MSRRIMPSILLYLRIIMPSNAVPLVASALFVHHVTPRNKVRNFLVGEKLFVWIFSLIKDCFISIIEETVCFKKKKYKA